MYDHGAGVELTGNIVGNIRRLRAVESPQLGNQRDVLVYLPPSYPVSGRHYPTICMHDGQNLFDAATSYAGEWQVDEALPSTAALAQHYDVSQAPVTRVLRMLAGEGLVRTVPRWGTFRA